MGTLAETVIVDYRLWFADQGKQTSVFRSYIFSANKRKFLVSVFRLQKTNRRCRFLLVLFSVCGNPETWSHGHRDM
jgi:hypothetical protein